jgi:hypothetical protein
VGMVLGLATGGMSVSIGFGYKFDSYEPVALGYHG